MGGNALSVDVLRLTKAQHQVAQTTLAVKLMKAFPVLQVKDIRALAEKESFGDVDVLLSPREARDDVVTLYDEGFLHCFAQDVLGAVEMVTNGTTLSAGVHAEKLGLVPLGLAAEDVVQVDFMWETVEAIEFASQFYAYNDISNFVGRVAAEMGTRLRHDGLWYQVEHEGQVLGEFLLTRDYAKALAFLGYPALPYAQGFETYAEAFEYLARGLFFNATFFEGEGHNSKTRRRYKTRKTHRAFRDWCAARSNALPAYEYPADRAVWHARMAEYFPSFEVDYYAKSAEVSAKAAESSRVKSVGHKYTGDRKSVV